MVYKFLIFPIIFMVGSLGQGDCASSSALISLKKLPPLWCWTFWTKVQNPHCATNNKDA